MQRVDASSLPAYFGGQLTDKDGNPKCLENICWGGKKISDFTNSYFLSLN